MPLVLGVVFATLIAIYGHMVESATHATIAKECERLGAFYVGERVYECKLKEKNT